MPLSNLFLRFISEHFWFYIRVVVAWLLILQTQMTLSHFLPYADEENLECKDHRIYPKIWERLQKESLISISSESYKKFIFWRKFSIYMVQTFLKKFWWQFLVPRSELLLISSATLSCKTCNISNFSVLLLQVFFWDVSHLCLHWPVHFINYDFNGF